MKLLLTFFIIINILFSKNPVIEISDVLQKDEIIAGCRFEIGDSTLWVGGKYNVYKINIYSSEIIDQLENGDKKLYLPVVFDKRDTVFVTGSLIKGRWNLVLYNIYNNTKRIVESTPHHMGLDFVSINSQDSSIIVGGAHFTRFVEWLDKYDENVISPSQLSINKFNYFYETQTAYTLTKYDFNLNLIDSCNYIERYGENYRGYDELHMDEVFDVDSAYNIYTIHKSSNYQIRKYSPDFRLLNEFNGNNEHFLSIPEKLNRDLAKRMRYIPGTFSNIYAIYVIRDTIITSFYQNPKEGGLLEAPFYYDIYTTSGNKVNTGELPYRIFTKDNKGNLYFLVKKENNWWFGKDRYYLVSFMLSDLMNNIVSDDYVEETLNKYLQKND